MANKSVKRPLRWPGGKGRLAGKIIRHFRPHRTYVEIFAGGAAVFWSKVPSRCEVLNDLDGDLITFYRVLHKRGRRLAKDLDAMPYSRAMLKRMARSRPTSEYGRARRFWYLNRVCFGAIGRGEPSYGVEKTAPTWVFPPTVLADVDAMVERLRGVSFECIDFDHCLRLYDSSETLFYLDPPYYEIDGLYRLSFTADDHRRLASALDGVQGHWLLSYNDHPEVRALYAERHWTRMHLRYKIRCNTRSYSGARSKARELLISNRPFRPAP